MLPQVHMQLAARVVAAAHHHDRLAGAPGAHGPDLVPMYDEVEQEAGLAEVRGQVGVHVVIAVHLDCCHASLAPPSTARNAQLRPCGSAS